MDSLYNLAVIVSVVDKLTGPVQKMAQVFSNFENKVQKAQGMIDFGNRLAVSGALAQGAADKTVRALSGLLTPVVANQAALGELSSLGIKDLGALTSAAQRFSAQWAGTTEAQFISAAYDIKSGIASLTDEGVAQFTTLAALTAKATKATTAEMTSLFATGYGIFKDLYGNMSDLQFGEMFSAGIAAAVQQFKTTGSGMSQALTTLGAAASTAKRPFEEQLAVLGMLQATMPGGEAGTKYKAFMQAAARAGTTLGLSFVDANGQLLGMVDILERLRGKYGDTLDAIEKQQIQKAFGSDEAVALIDLLYGKVDALRGNITTLNTAMGQGVVFTEGMARAMNDDLGASLAVLNQNIEITKGFIGDQLAPLIKAFIPSVQDWVAGLQSFSKTHPTLTRLAVLFAALAAAALSVIAPILSVAGALYIFGGQGIKAFAWLGRGVGAVLSRLFYGLRLLGPVTLRAGVMIGQLAFRVLFFATAAGIRAYGALLRLASGIGAFARGAILAAARALPALIASVWSFTAALLANPITWVVVAIVGLGAAVWALARNWDTVVAWMGNAWQRMVAFARQNAPLLLAVIMPVVGIPLLIARNWDTIKDAVGNAITAAVNRIRARAQELWASGRALIDAFVAGIRSIINKPAEVVHAGLAKLRRLLPFSDAKEGPLSTLTYSGMALINTFASGIQARAPYLQAVAASALGGIALPAAGLGSWGTSPLGRTPAVNLREVIRESSRERESVFTRDRRPIVVVVGGGQKPARGFEDYIDQALRYLDMQGD